MTGQTSNFFYPALFLAICVGWVVVLLLPDWIAELKEARLVKLGQKMLLLAVVAHAPMGCRTPRAMSYSKIDSFLIVKAPVGAVHKVCRKPVRCCFREENESNMGFDAGMLAS